MKIKVNGAEIETAKTGLKEVLEDAGYFFPCGGKGLCGKCRALAPTLPSTERDRTFLTPEDLLKGVRLACDKAVSEGLEITTELQIKPKPRKLGECDILAVLGNRTMLIGILSDGTLVDSMILENDGKTVGTGREKTRAIRSVVAREAIGFFERYGAAKATEIYVIGTAKTTAALIGDADRGELGESRPASLYELPAEEVLFAPGAEPIDFLMRFQMPEQTLAERAVRFATDVRFRAKLFSAAKIGRDGNADPV